MDKSHFTLEVEGADTLVFKAYRKAFSSYSTEELKVVVIANLGLHWIKNIKISDGIQLIKIPPYTCQLTLMKKYGTI